MVTIKKHGVFCKEERCKYCGCVIEYGPRDVTYEFDYNNSQDKYYVECPDCGHKIYVDKKI